MKNTLLAGAILTFATAAQAELQPEQLGKVLTLPEKYPPHWIIVHDATFFHMLDGRQYVIDADAETLPEQVKGMFNSSFIATVNQSSVRPEMYVAETYYTRGSRGTRTDVLTIYDKRTLEPVDEVILPNNNRYSGMPNQYAHTLIDNERLVLIFNLNPATSLSVVDLEERKYLGEIPIPGCSLAFPTGERGFTSICAGGDMYSVQLNADGTMASSARTESFNDIDNNPLFEKPAMVGSTAYFPTFLGDMVEVDLSGPAAMVGERWSLRQGDDDGWRPGGMTYALSDAEGQLYVLAHPAGYDGSHKDPGIEVWLYDPATRKRTARHPLKTPGLSIALTRDAEAPLMIVTNIEMGLDVYDAKSGKYLRTVTGFGQETPFVVHGAR
ncbi:MAG: amine dehydrogenase large subunit [Pseudomonadota bacterium]